MSEKTMLEARGLWAILPEALEELLAGPTRAPEAAAPRPTARTPGAVAVLPLHGPITQRGGWYGRGLDAFMGDFRQVVADPVVKAIVIDIDSPGGSVFGVDEAAAEIFRAREQKHIVAVANSLAASAAYQIASAASELVVSPSSLVGSIGVFSVHMDMSKALERMGVHVTFVAAGKYKTEGNYAEPLSEEARAGMQAIVDGYYDLFVRAVARGRGVSPAAVRGGFGEGRLVAAAEAVKLGMADRVATLDETLARLGVAPGARGASAEEELLLEARRRELAALEL